MRIGSISPRQSREAIRVGDLIFLAIGLGLFALMGGYIAALRRL